MEVRRFEQKSDAAGIIRVQSLAWREAYADILPADLIEQQPVDPADAEVQRWYEGLSENSDGVFVAVESDETVCGFADFRWGAVETKEFVGEDEAGLKAIYVHPDRWGEGIGTALLEHGIQNLPADVEAIRLEMLSGNEIGHEFYMARGFKRTGTATHELGGTEYPTDIYTLRL